MGSIGELPLELRLFTNYVAATRVVTYFDVASAMMFIYDYFLTMGLEVELVWGSRWGFMKALYIVQRYIPFVDSVALCFTHQFGNKISPAMCRIVETWRGWTMIAGFSLSELVLTLHAWAVWKKDRRLGVFLLFVFISSVAASFVVTAFFFRGVQFGERPYPEFFGCFVTGSNRIVYLNWVILMFYEAVILVLMIVPGIAAYRQGGDVALHDVIYRNGIMAYVYLFILSTINVIVVISLPESYLDMLSSVEHVLHSMLTSRVLLRIRAYMTRQVWSDGFADLQVNPVRPTGISFTLPHKGIEV